MKTKKFLPFLIGLLMSVSLVWVINNNQNQKVSASVFRKVSVLGMVMIIPVNLKDLRLLDQELC